MSPKANYPRGKLHARDEGELAFAMRLSGNTLVIDFGKPVKWIGLGLQGVRDLRAKLAEFEQTLAGYES